MVAPCPGGRSKQIALSVFVHDGIQSSVQKGPGSPPHVSPRFIGKNNHSIVQEKNDFGGSRNSGSKIIPRLYRTGTMLAAANKQNNGKSSNDAFQRIGHLVAKVLSPCPKSDILLNIETCGEKGSEVTPTDSMVAYTKG
mmetsp:Transcript_29000/g.41540  ORF Transcript_29000/g.41540 Transcript_29000/m.41540 type:complete len:139 (+) Transcript_29000:494-910(+)